MAICSRNILSLCAGVGGLELGILLALHSRGEAGRGICYVEREAAAAASLVASMDAGWLHPAPVWSDMLTFDARPWRGRVHILASGDPCQDNSVAGKGAGSSGSRFLAPEVCRHAEECRPDLIFRENVPGNADGQLEAIVASLERLGYRVAAGIFSSAETGNTMRRERLFIMARAANDEPSRSGRARAGGQGFADGSQRMEGSGASGALDDANDSRHRRKSDPRDQAIQPDPSGRARFLPPVVVPGPADRHWNELLDRFPEYQPALSKEEAQSHLRRGVDAMAHRVERLRATGNGVDPMVAAYAFLSLAALHDEARAAA